MRLPPPDVLATWPTPNYVDPHTRGNGALIVNVVCLSFAFVVTLLRLYTRLKITYSPGLDDILIVIALVRGKQSRRRTDAGWLLIVLGLCHCDVRHHLYCDGTIRLGPTYMGCPADMAFYCLETQSCVSNPVLGVLLCHQTFAPMVLQASSRRRK